MIVIRAFPWLALTLITILITPQVQAHVKWFADWTIVICPPRDPMHVITSTLWQLLFAACVIVMAGLAWLDVKLSAPHGRIQIRLHHMHLLVQPHGILVLRWGLCLYWLMTAFMIATPVFLTPELAAPPWIRWVQVTCALLILRRESSWLAGLGMIVMYVLAAFSHGWFHLLDYPLFLGIGFILLLPRLSKRCTDTHALHLLRVSAAITLLWGGIEKFAFPEWSFMMLQANPMLSLGVSPEAAMYMYGFGELALAFGLLLFGVGSQVSACLLLITFVSAVLPFGWIEWVGHSGIVVALVLLSITQPAKSVQRRVTAYRNALYLHTISPDPVQEAIARAQRAEVRALQASKLTYLQSQARVPLPKLESK
jgi:hypothetical protein